MIDYNVLMWVMIMGHGSREWLYRISLLRVVPMGWGFLASFEYRDVMNPLLIPLPPHASLLEYGKLHLASIMLLEPS